MEEDAGNWTPTLACISLTVLLTGSGNKWDFFFFNFLTLTSNVRQNNNNKKNISTAFRSGGKSSSQ